MAMIKVMIVDDSSIARKMMKIALNPDKHQILGEAACGKQAIELIKTIKPHVVAMDYDMPDMTGVEAAKIMKTMVPQLEFIFVSATDVSQFYAETDANLVKNCILKPVTREKITLAINAALNPEARPEVVETIEEQDLLKDLNLRMEQLVTVTHYSGVTSLKSLIINMGFNELSIKLTKDFVLNNFYENEPVVIGVDTGKDVYLLETLLKKINISTKSFDVKVLGIDKVENSRKFERVPTSIYVEIGLQSKKAKIKGILKDLSIGGMNIISHQDLQEEEKIELDIFTDNDVINFLCEVKWKASMSDCFSYGLEILYRPGDSGKKKFIERLIENVKLEHAEKILKLKNL